MRKILTKNCLWCGKEFAKKPSVSMKEWTQVTKFCSYKCYGESQRNPPLICETCGKSFRRTYYGKKYAHTFCSRECRGISERKPFPLCEMCGETCKKHSARFCSRECKVLWYRGENAYNYVGENFRKDAYPVDYSFWMRKAETIRKRDKVCSHCGKTPEQNGRALDVHHKIPFRISHSNLDDNLIALCRMCHKKADHEYNSKR